MSSQAQLLDDPSLATSQRLSSLDVEETQVAPATRSGLAIELRGVAKAFGARDVLRSLDLTIHPGEFVVIVGRSGGGKSTLLRLVAGLDRPSAGAVAIDGRPISGLQDSTRIMFQDARLLPWKSVLNNVMLGLGRGAREDARAVLNEVGLLERANDWPAQL